MSPFLFLGASKALSNPPDEKEKISNNEEQEMSIHNAQNTDF